MRSVFRVLVELRSALIVRHRSKAYLAGTLLATAALGFGGCAQSPQQLAASPHSKEYFPSSVYGPASRRVIADGEPVPHGGGQYLVGKPYTIAGQTYYPSERKVTQVGLASWYGDAFHGRLTANGEIYDRGGFTAAHPTMPLPSYARVTNLRNGYSMVVRVNDRGPYHSNRVMDVSSRVAETLDFKRYGTSKVKIEYVGRASLAGSDDARLYATLRTDGPAPTRGLEETLMVAEAAPRPARVASLAPYVPESTYPSRTTARSPTVGEGDRAVRSEAAARPRRPLHLAEREGEGMGDDAPAVTRPLRALSSSRPARGSYKVVAQVPPFRQASRMGNGFEMRHPLRMASREDSAAARAFAVQELMPPTRPGRAAARDVTRAEKKAVGASQKNSSDKALLPSRPVRLASAAPMPRHHVGGMHSTRTRDD